MAISQTLPINWQPENEVNFFNYPELAHEIQGFTQDKRGYMWVGSQNGLYRFDGVDFRRYVNVNGDTDAIAGNNCRPLLVDSRDMMWIATSKGLSMLNTSTYKFKNYNYTDTLFNDIITGVVEDENKNIWISSFGRMNLTKYEHSKNKFTAYSIPDTLYTNGMRTFDMTYNTDGKLYLAVDNGILVFNPVTESYCALGKAATNKNNFCGITQCIFSDKDGVIYTGYWTNPKGKLYIGVYNVFNKQFTYFIAHVNIKYENTISITEKSGEELWIGTNNSGLFIFNKRTLQLKQCTHRADDPGSFPEKPASLTQNVFKDREGSFWINAKNKIVKANPIDNQILRYDLQKILGENNDIDFHPTSIVKLKDQNKLYIGTWSGAGFYIVDNSKKTLRKQFVNGSRELHNIAIVAILKNSKGEYLACTKNQLFFLHQVNDKPHSISITPEFPTTTNTNFSFINMLEDSRGHCWLGSYRHGVFDIDLSTKTHINYPKESYNPTFLKSDFMKPCFEDKQQNIWFSSFDGVYLFNLNHQSFKRISYEDRDSKYNDGRDLLEDNHGNIWRTTSGGGFQKFNPYTKKFEVVAANIDTKQLRMEDMVEDNRGYIWINSDEGILRFDPANKIFLIPKQSMQIDMGNSIVGFCKEDGTLYTCRGAMLYETNTYLFDGNTHIPPIVFNGFKVLNRDTTFTENLNDLTLITLPYDKNFISIEFAALNFSHSKNNQYAYKLEGIEKDWVMNGNKNSASYSNLAPGNYAFHVKASNNTGLWNETGKSLIIIITPPWWQMWWFRLLVAVTVAMAVWYAIKIYTGRKLHLLKIEFEKQQALQFERTRISSDLHDDIGSNLTSIALLSEVAKSSTDKLLTEKNLNLISTSAGELIDKMSEIIWAMNSKNDTLENLISYIREYASKYFEPYEFKLKFEIPETIAHHVINSNLRRTVFLVVKESLHNIVKHAGVCEVNIQFQVSNKNFSVHICDNGKGFEINNVRRYGNGINNMNNRMNEIKAHYEIKSALGNGTTTHLNIPI